MNELNFSQVIKGCTHQSTVHQKQLYQHCFAGMMKVCLRYCRNMDDAAACYNEAMRKVFLKIEQCRNEAAFMGWVKKIVVNTCITELASRTRFEKRHTAPPEEDDSNLSVQPFPTTAQEMLQYVQQLPATHLLVFNLYAVEGYTHEEISQMLGIAAGTSKWYLSEARNKLKQSLTTASKYETDATYR